MRRQKSAKMFGYHFVCFPISLETSCLASSGPCDWRILNLMSLIVGDPKVHVSSFTCTNSQYRDRQINRICSWNIVTTLQCTGICFSGFREHLPKGACLQAVDCEAAHWVLGYSQGELTVALCTQRVKVLFLFR